MSQQKKGGGNIAWLPNWYATRMHAVPEENTREDFIGPAGGWFAIALCGNQAFRGAPRPWMQRRLDRGVKRCAHCRKKDPAMKQTELTEKQATLIKETMREVGNINLKAGEESEPYYEIASLMSSMISGGRFRKELRTFEDITNAINSLSPGVARKFLIRLAFELFNDGGVEPNPDKEVNGGDLVDLVCHSFQEFRIWPTGYE